MYEYGIKRIDAYKLYINYLAFYMDLYKHYELESLKLNATANEK